jgi:hypothetical protein
MTRLWLLLPVIAFLLGACKRSDRTLELPGNTLTLVAPAQLRPTGAVPLAFDRRGELMVVMHESEEADDADELEVEIRSVQTSETEGSRKRVDAFPFMFRDDSAALYCVNQDGILELDLTSNATRLLNEGSYLPKARNAAQTISVLEGQRSRFLAINSKGDILLSTGQPAFDQFGNAWAKTSNGWNMLGPRQSAIHRPSRPTYLVTDQSGLRGAMQLVTKKDTITRRGADALVSTIWLDHSQAMGDRRSALVFAGADVLYAGFVPNKNLVWVITAESSYVVPFTLRNRD